MVEELRLWAVNIEVFRQCFAPPGDMADSLFQICDQFTPADTRARSKNLLSKLGPLLRHPPTAPLIRPGVPNRHDAESMMTSRFIDSDRLSACWVLAQAWLDHLAVSHATIPLPSARIDEMEFDLVRAGVPTQVSIRHLWRLSIDIPLRALDGMSVGYMDHPTVLHLIEQWTMALPDLEESTRQFATPLLAFTTPFPEHPQDQPPPDLIALWTIR